MLLILKARERERERERKMMSGNYNSIDSQKVSGSVPVVPDHAPDVTIKFSKTNLQTFPPSQVQGKISSGTRPPQKRFRFHCSVLTNLNSKVDGCRCSWFPRTNPTSMSILRMFWRELKIRCFL